MDKGLFKLTREELKKSWIRCCDDNVSHPEAKTLFRKDSLPDFHDPFAGGGAIPIEAQRFGIKSYASDLNPVAVSLNKAMIEIPPIFANLPPISSNTSKINSLLKTSWTGAAGLAEDINFYGEEIRKRAECKIGHLYPKLLISDDLISERSDLGPLKGKELTVIAWIFSKTVNSPNPAFSDVKVPLASTFLLSSNPTNQAYIEPIINGKTFKFKVKSGIPKDIEEVKSGTKIARGANFRCLFSGTAIDGNHIKEAGKNGDLSSCLMAVVAEGPHGRIYASPTIEHEGF